MSVEKFRAAITTISNQDIALKMKQESAWDSLTNFLDKAITPGEKLDLLSEAKKYESLFKATTEHDLDTNIKFLQRMHEQEKQERDNAIHRIAAEEAMLAAIKTFTNLNSNELDVVADHYYSIIRNCDNLFSELTEIFIKKINACLESEPLSLKQFKLIEYIHSNSRFRLNTEQKEKIQADMMRRLEEHVANPQVSNGEILMLLEQLNKGILSYPSFVLSPYKEKINNWRKIIEDLPLTGVREALHKEMQDVHNKITAKEKKHTSKGAPRAGMWENIQIDTEDAREQLNELGKQMNEISSKERVNRIRRK